MRLVKLLFILIFLCITNSVWAAVGNILQTQKDITLYTEPDSKAKILINLPKGQQLIPVYEQGEWIKVANPANGETGWVNKNILQQAAPAATPPVAVIRSYIVTNQGNAEQKVYQIDTNGDVKALQGKQAESAINQITAQQKQMQVEFNKMLVNTWQNFLMTQDFFKKFNQQIDQQLSTITPPVIVMTQDKIDADKSSIKEKK